jgi:hypothetical protein
MSKMFELNPFADPFSYCGGGKTFAKCISITQEKVLKLQWCIMRFSKGEVINLLAEFRRFAPESR